MQLYPGPPGIYPAPSPQRRTNRPLLPTDPRRRRIIVLIVIYIILLSLIPITWPASTAPRTTYEGEVWGNLRANGRIWGEQHEEQGGVQLWHWTTDGGGGSLRVNVTNVSRVRLVDLPDGEDRWINCTNGTFEIIADNDYFDSQWTDVNLDCTYMEFNCTFGFDTSDYNLQNRLSSIDGTARVTHNASLPYDFDLLGSPVLVDGIVYENADILVIPEGDVANVSMHGTGHMRAGDDELHPHVNGTLEVDRFVDLRGRWSHTYQTIRFSGDDIDIRTINPIDYNYYQWSTPSNPWVIRVTLPKDGTVEFHETHKLPLWGEYTLMCCVAAILAIIYIEHVRGRRQRRDGPKQG